MKDWKDDPALMRAICGSPRKGKTTISHEQELIRRQEEFHAVMTKVIADQQRPSVPQHPDPEVTRNP